MNYLSSYLVACQPCGSANEMWAAGLLELPAAPGEAEAGRRSDLYARDQARTQSTWVVAGRDVVEAEKALVSTPSACVSAMKND